MSSSPNRYPVFILALVGVLATQGCNFTMEPDPGATEPGLFGEDPEAGAGAVNTPNPFGGMMDGQGGSIDFPAAGEDGAGGTLIGAADAAVPGADSEIGEPEGALDAGSPHPLGPDGGMPCADLDADRDGLCDGVDPICNADGQAVTCRRAQPMCPDGLVPEAREGCYTGRCVSWDMCGQGGACPDVDGDGICDLDDPVCNPDGEPVTCEREAPMCPEGQVPTASAGCYSGECVSWDACQPVRPCADADHDGHCDAMDAECNADGSPVSCERPPPACPPDHYPEITLGCYTERCLTWEECDDVLLLACMADEACPDDRWCRETLDPVVSQCVPYLTEGDVCGGFQIPSEARRCHPTTACSDRDPRLPDGEGVCRAICDAETPCEDEAYCAVADVCRIDGECHLAADCLRPGNDYPAPFCEGWPTCNAENRCDFFCGDPRCIDLAGVDFGPCERGIGVARINGVCMTISGCNAGDFRLFDDLQACLQGCR